MLNKKIIKQNCFLLNSNVKNFWDTVISCSNKLHTSATVFNTQSNQPSRIDFLLNPRNPYTITRKDIISLEEYENIRPQVIEFRRYLKKARRLELGPHASITFQNYSLLWIQIQEMLRIEKGGEGQISDELEAYSPLLPNGKELVFTLMFEIDEPKLRHKILSSIGHIEDQCTLNMDGISAINAIPTNDGIERTTPEGKTSAVHFLKFPMESSQIKTFCETTKPILVGAEHKNYFHKTIVQGELLHQLRQELSLPL